MNSAADEAIQRVTKMAPLIRSILHEAQDRSREIHRLEHQQRRWLATGSRKIARLHRAECELFRHRREMGLVQRELAHLGCSLDPEHPNRITCSIADTEITFENVLGAPGPVHNR